MHRLALAIGTYNINPPAGVPQFGDNGAQTLLSLGITILITLAIVLALVFLLWNGLRWIMSEGDKQKVQNARQGITYAIIGLLVAFFAIFIINLIGSVFGVDLTGNPFRASTASTIAPSWNCPDGSKGYDCNRKENGCEVCSSVDACTSGTYTMASCSGTAYCETDGSTQDCEGLASNCPVGQTGTVVCNKPPGQSHGYCITENCHSVSSGVSTRN